MNLKMPCVLNAQKIAKVEQSTPECDAIALIATAVSSIVTIVVLAIGLIPALIVSALTIIGIASAGVASYLLIIMIPLTILCARILWKKGVIRVETVKEDK